MNLDEFAKLVRELRESQKTFFRDRSQQALNRAKQLERDVDTAVAEILSKQPRLYE